VLSLSCSSTQDTPSEPDAAVPHYDAGTPTCDADLATNRFHCGSCTNACASGQSCVDGGCVPDCNAPLIKCEGADVCVDLTNDLQHCGGCGTVCSQVDAGGYEAGDPVDDGGEAGAPSWTYGTLTCANSSCQVVCPQGTTECGGLCFDMSRNRDHCGTCNNACASNENCSVGKCCKGATVACGGHCADLSRDMNHCGDCTTTCSSQSEFCSQGQCVPANVYQAAFQGNITAHSSSQCTDWQTWLGNLTGPYNGIVLRGLVADAGPDAAPTERSCVGPQANALCQALKNGTATNVTCGDAGSWATGTYNTSVGVAAQSTTVSTCTNPGYVARPCTTNTYWGGVGTATCPGPSQTISVICY
jgi:hypothetical protein